MAARLSPGSWPDAAGVAAKAGAVRERAVQLADEDGEAHRLALEARAAADEAAKPEQRDWTLGQITAAAAEPPLALVRLGADLAELCAAAAGRVEPRVHADVAAAAALAAAVARGARALVAANPPPPAGGPPGGEGQRPAPPPRAGPPGPVPCEHPA